MEGNIPDDVMKSMVTLLRGTPDFKCKDLHHNPFDYHDYDDKCPVVQRLNEAHCTLSRWLRQQGNKV